MTSEEQINAVANKPTTTKRTDDCTNFTQETSTVNLKGDPEKAEIKVRKAHDLMRLVYELPEEERGPVDIIHNNNMLKETPPLRIVEITDQNGCDNVLDKVTTDENCDNDIYLRVDDSSPDNSLGNKVVLDVLATNELILNCAEEFREVIERPPSDECSDEDLHELKRILDNNPRVLDRYMRECASSDEVIRLHNLTSSSGPLSPRPNHQARSTSVTSDLFQLWLASSPVKVSDNGYQFYATRLEVFN